MRLRTANRRRRQRHESEERVWVDFWRELKQFHRSVKELTLVLDEYSDLVEKRRVVMGVDPASPDGDHSAIVLMDFSEVERRILAHIRGNFEVPSRLLYGTFTGRIYDGQ